LDPVQSGAHPVQKKPKVHGILAKKQKNSWAEFRCRWRAGPPSGPFRNFVLTSTRTFHLYQLSKNKNTQTAVQQHPNRNTKTPKSYIKTPKPQYKNAQTAIQKHNNPI